MTAEKWYKGGLRFACTECGGCCTGGPGYVWVTPEEIEAIATFLNLSVEQFSRQYVRRVGQRYSLTERKTSYDCIFLKEKRCTIYPHRPKQCRTFPWWDENLKTPESWKTAAKECEGICDTAPLVSLKTIEEKQEK